MGKNIKLYIHPCSGAMEGKQEGDLSVKVDGENDSADSSQDPPTSPGRPWGHGVFAFTLDFSLVHKKNNWPLPPRFCDYRFHFANSSGNSS